MRLIFFFFLGVITASPVLADETTDGGLSTISEDNYTSETEPINNDTISISSTSNSMNITFSTITPTGDENWTDGNVTETVMPTATTPKPIPVSTDQKPPITHQKRTTAQPLTQNDGTGIVIVIIIILLAVVFAVACYVARKRGRRYSVDFTSRPDETNIPLSGVEPGVPVAETAPLNGIQVFESEEPTAKEPQEAEINPKAKEEQEAETDKPDPDAERAAAVPDKAEQDTTSEDVVGQQSPATPGGAGEEEKTDLEGAVSDKTSEDTLKETNENNSNNAVSSHKDSDPSNVFGEVPLDRPLKDIIASV